MSDTIRGGTCFFCEAAWAGISRSLRLSKREIEILQRLMLGDDTRGLSGSRAALLHVSAAP